jgi:Fe-S-cluster containining protein
VAFSREVIRELLAGSAAQRLASKETYTQLPSTRCRRRTHCCSLLPEMSLVEALTAVQLLVDMVPEQRLQVSKRLLRYFFLNPVEILSCPFLEGNNCLVYLERFFGCRAYGLWSRKYYQRQAELSQQAKLLGQQQWQRLGVALPQEIVNFHVNYCPHVEVEGDVSVNDELLVQTSDVIDSISAQLVPWHDQFRQEYFSDLSFLLASISLGLQEAIQLKFDIVRDYLANGNQDRLAKIIEDYPDICVGLI